MTETDADNVHDQKFLTEAARYKCFYGSQFPCQRKCTQDSILTKACMLGNQSDVFNLNKKEQKQIKKQTFIQSTPC